MGKDAPAASIDEVVAQATRDLDLETKISLLTGGAVFSLRGEDSIGLREMIFSDGRPASGAASSPADPRWRCSPTRRCWPSPGTRTRPTGRRVAGRGGRGASTWTSCSVRRSTCIDPRSAAGCSRPTPRTRCSPAGLPRRTSAGCRARRRGVRQAHLANESETERKTVNSQSSTMRRCARSTCCRSRSASTTPTRGRSWPRTTTSTAWPRPSTTRSTTGSSRANGAGTD